MPDRTLAGLRVVVTREHLEPLGAALRARGAEPVHLPSIAVADPDDGGAELAHHLARLDDYDWLVVTSPNGADRVGAAAAGRRVRLAAVGSSTEASLAARCGRGVDVVPDVQRADQLGAAMLEALGPPPVRVLVAQADRAGSRLTDALRAAGHDVTTVTAYRTITTPPDLTALDERPADALLLASGSAAAAWSEALRERRAGTTARPEETGRDRITPPLVVAIGPSTADAARTLGLEVSAVAHDHSLAGLVAALESVADPRRRGSAGS